MLSKVKAWWRGERRIAPAGQRGRVFERKSGGRPVHAVARLKANLSMRVYRAATDTWESVN